MNRNGHVLILHNSVTDESPADARDILEQLRCVQAALISLGHETSTQSVDLGLDRLKASLRAAPPDVVFNLVEAIDDSGQLVPMVTALLDHLGIAYTGAGTEALMLTSHKVLTKRWLRACGIRTPDWWAPQMPIPGHPGPGRWIAKPISEDASIGMDDQSVVPDFASLPDRIAAKQDRPGRLWFGERFVEGREINVALLAGPHGPEVLPVPEIEFVNYPAGKPRIVGYAAKWNADSFECRNTVRRFVDPVAEAALCADLGTIAMRCWELFSLRGYARVDFRVDGAGVPWVLEVNANPCISPDAGFAAALHQAGMEYAEGIRRIVADAWTPPA